MRTLEKTKKTLNCQNCIEHTEGKSLTKRCMKCKNYSNYTPKTKSVLDYHPAEPEFFCIERKHKVKPSFCLEKCSIPYCKNTAELVQAQERANIG